MKLESGYEIVTPEEDVSQYLKKNVNLYGKGLCKILPNNIYHSICLAEHVLPKVYEQKFTSTDVFVCSFPRCGSTWLQQIVWAMAHNPNLDHKDSDNHAYEQALYLEMDTLFFVDGYPTGIIQYLEDNHFTTFLDRIDHMESPRIFKTHLPIDMFPKSAQENSKFIYIVRNPLDACVSFYHFFKDMHHLGFQGDLDEFVERFTSGILHQGPYFEHLKCWAIMKDRPNVLTIFYEDLRKDTFMQVKKMDEFLGTNLTSEQFENVLHYCSFPEMVKRDPLRQSKVAREEILRKPDAKGVLRSGKNNSSDDLTAEQKTKIKRHFRKQLGDIPLPYDFSDE